MKLEHILLAQYDGRALLPVDVVCRDFFPHLAPAKFVRHLNEGRIRLPLVRTDSSQKSAKFIAVTHLAAYLDAQTAAAEKEAMQLAGTRRSA